MAEEKFRDEAVTSYACNSTATLLLLNGCTLGTDIGNRIGRKTVVTHIQVRGWVATELGATQPPSGTGSPVSTQVARFILVRDKQANGSPFGGTDLLVSASPAAQFNLNNRNRFEILADQTYCLDPACYSLTVQQAVSSFNNQIKPVLIDVKCKKVTIYNSNNTGNVSDISTGSIYLLWIGNNTGGTGTDMVTVLSTRCKFVDY